MSFIEKNLSVNERILYTTQIHWYIYLRGLFITLLGIIIAASASKPDNFVNGLVGLLVFVGIVLLINAFLVSKSSEFAVTNKRVVLKTGVLKRQLVELQLNRAEGLVVSQSIMGRIFNFGSIRITSGGVTETFSRIAAPFEFKKQVNNAIETSFVINPNSPSF
jgi:uncharacterized membrane protein YdbT with pleckstrin-like domain